MVCCVRTIAYQRSHLTSSAFSFVGLLGSPADVIDATAEKRGDTWTVSATIRHADTGWDHYADRFVVVAPDGTVLATRVLAHPHVNEQPFTRSVSGVTIPDGVDYVTVRADDNLMTTPAQRFVSTSNKQLLRTIGDELNGECRQQNAEQAGQNDPPVSPSQASALLASRKAR